MHFKFILRTTFVLFRCTFCNRSCLFLFFSPSCVYNIKLQLLTGTQCKKGAVYLILKFVDDCMTECSRELL